MKVVNEIFLDLVKKVEYTLCPQYCGVVDRRRVIAYIFFTMIELVMIPLHFVLFLTYWEPKGFTVACVHFVAFAVIQWMIWRQNVEFKQGVSAMFMLVALKLVVDSVLCTFFGMREDHVTVLSNLFILFILISVELSLVLNKVAGITTVMLVPLTAFYFIFRPWGNIFAVKPIMVGYFMIFYVYSYNRSKFAKGLRQPREVSEEERKALEMLANLKDTGDGKREGLIERLSPETRERIVHHASVRLRKRELDNLAWDLVCAELTASEKQICRLILDGLSLKEICDKLGKTESNITCQRSHIRKKLNMDRSDDLRNVLERRIAEVRKEQ